MQIHTEKNQKEVKSHGSYAFPVHVSPESIHAYEQHSFLWHWHQEIELTWIMSGQMEYLVNDQKYLLSEGDGLFCNTNALHSGHAKNHQECTYLSVTFHPRFLYGYESSLIQTKYMDFILTNEAWHSLALTDQVAWQADILEKLCTIYALSLNPPADYELTLHLLLTAIWQQLYRYYSSLPLALHRPPKEMERLKLLLSYLQEHYRQEVTLDEISTHLNICKSECCRFFKKYMRMTIFDYLLFFRIQNSLSLLESGESITKTAGMVGFSTPAYYGQIFKRYMGCSPSQYRKNSRILTESTDAGCQPRC